MKKFSDIDEIIRKLFKLSTELKIYEAAGATYKAKCTRRQIRQLIGELS